MQDSLTVDVNPEGMHTLRVPESFETQGGFDVVLRNHGESTHVYLNLDAELSEVATLDATNYYIEQGETLSLTIPVSSGIAVEGELTVATAYGSEKRLVPVSIKPAPPDHSSVNVDSTLSGSRRPRRTNGAGPTPSPPRKRPTIDEQTIRRALPAVVFGTIAIALALSSVFVAGGLRIGLGLLALLAGSIVIVQLSD
ncbi:DUF7524 family protein [Halocatena pleomorpha]|uniref:Uncharacterized protein n=1 Tax=Halocatena pleomorpha TaxID=1785090 RepID=A0A3P3REU0_9EURY|nr:hypothetical protein [Halocatena pleomorpha]RRJ32022.1 hypothetical protein EIK79_05700 [Halocatena pleomorpha]